MEEAEARAKPFRERLLSQFNKPKVQRRRKHNSFSNYMTDQKRAKIPQNPHMETFDLTDSVWSNSSAIAPNCLEQPIVTLPMSSNASCNTSLQNYSSCSVTLLTETSSSSLNSSTTGSSNNKVKDLNGLLLVPKLEETIVVCEKENAGVNSIGDASTAIPDKTKINYLNTEVDDKDDCDQEKDCK